MLLFALHLCQILWMMPHCFSLLSCFTARGLFLILAIMQCFIPPSPLKISFPHVVLPCNMMQKFSNFSNHYKKSDSNVCFFMNALFYILSLFCNWGGFTHSNITKLFSLRMWHSITDLFSCYFKVKCKTLDWLVFECILEIFEENAIGFITCHILISSYFFLVSLSTVILDVVSVKKRSNFMFTESFQLLFYPYFIPLCSMLSFLCLQKSSS